LISVFVTRPGAGVIAVDELDPVWLEPGSDAMVWVDLAAPTSDEALVLSRDFHFHELAIEDSLSAIHHPKIETYNGVLYLILHGIHFKEAQHRFATHDVDFFLGRNYLVTVHDGQSRSIKQIRDVCSRTDHILREGPGALMHRIIDTMIDNYRPEVEKLEERLDAVESQVFGEPRTSVIQEILKLKQDVASLRRVTLPQRDVVGRLARHEFPIINEQLVYRFRDVHDHLVRLSDEAMFFQDRITGILDAHLAAVSNRLNEVVKLLAIIATGLMPLTVITGMWGMNVPLPMFPGGERAQFWWVTLLMAGTLLVLVALFRRRRWL
jgi:magnesium transporter